MLNVGIHAFEWRDTLVSHHIVRFCFFYKFRNHLGSYRIVSDRLLVRNVYAASLFRPYAPMT